MSYPDHDHDGLLATAIFATIASVAALFVSLGPCFEQENLTSKVDHLERRLDNIADGRR